MLSFATFVILALSVAAHPSGTQPATDVTPASPRIGQRCVGEITSLADVAAAEKCLTINIRTFVVPAGQSLDLNPVDGATVTMQGPVSFAHSNWAGPLMTISGNNIVFNGQGYELNGNGDQYWDGLGGNGGVVKPAPMLRVRMSGTFENVKVLNTPMRAISVNANNVLVRSINIDNSAGDVANSQSNGKPAGHNTDGFDVSGNNVRIENSQVHNQDDCLALNRGTNVTFTGNTCTGQGHGISIGSIGNNTVVSDVILSGNTITNNGNAIRIKTKADASGSSVSNIVVSNNKATGITGFGVLIDQSYPATLGTAGTGVKISGVSFSGTNTFAVTSKAKRVAVNCGSTSSCSGTWDFSGLTVTGGQAGSIKNAPVKGGSF
ncbi:unnamed protein product [Mycena citricolor]|uniref:endo-polygalacturonase n=1 Tax=Mycena citricolor TaxID=2018698 RepID=A0AAD2K7T7_9AGAR|nr:unnamed protein product [Mycena citricolor]